MTNTNVQAFPARRHSINTVTAKTSFEIEVELTGTFVRGYPMTGPSYASGGEPGEPDSVEDIDIAEIGSIAANWGRGSYGSRPVWTTTSLLNGVDRTSAAYQQIVANIIEILGEDAVSALVGEAGE